MLPELAAALMMALYGLGASISLPDAADLASPRALAIEVLPPAAFRSAERSVTNWRQQAALQLELVALEAAQTFAGGEPRGTSRCVRLNNYWCIKRAGWSGEIAADPEGHVGFATALDGATVAALLLRRYYLTYSRHSALAIVSRWAPAQCGGASAAPARRIAPGAAKAFAPKGLGGTLRARFLAGHTRGGQKTAARGGPSMRRTIIADRSLSLMPAPEIAVGHGRAFDIRYAAPAEPEARRSVEPYGRGAARGPADAGCAILRRRHAAHPRVCDAGSGGDRAEHRRRPRFVRGRRHAPVRTSRGS